MTLVLFMVPAPIATESQVKARKLDSMLPSVRSVPKYEKEFKALEIPKTQP